MNPIQFNKDDTGYSVTYTSPVRKFGSLREELNNDAITINKEQGPVYLAFSSGLDSQVILRCFIDMRCDFIPFFVHVVGKNDFEYDMVLKSEKFYGIKIEKHIVDIDSFKDEWIQHSIDHNIPTCLHYPLVHVINQLPEDLPIVTSGANEPCIVGSTNSEISIYHNYYEQMRLRFRMIGSNRKVFDFPYSSESLASYYCDDIVKTYANTSAYFKDNNLVYSSTNSFPPTDYFNMYVKPFVKGSHFKKDVLYPSKRTGFELFPSELVRDLSTPKDARISAKYIDVVEHLEKCDGSTKTFNTWHYPAY